MAEYLIMPKLGLNMDNGTIIKWRKKEGDFIKEQETVFEIETDKTTMEVEAQISGILRKIIVNEGKSIPEGEVRMESIVSFNPSSIGVAVSESCSLALVVSNTGVFRTLCSGSIGKSCPSYPGKFFRI